MYITIHGNPFPEFANIEKTFIPEPLSPCEDEILVALLPLDHGSIVLSVTDNDDVEYAYSVAKEKGLDKENIDWTVVDRDAFMDIVIPHMKTYLSEQLKQAIAEALAADHNNNN